MDLRYNTKQKQVLLNFLNGNKNRHLSIAEIANAVKDEGIGKSTVYRRMTELCDDGVVRRFRGKDGKNVVYQFMDSDKNCNSHFHLKCTECGALQHLDCESMDKISNHIKEHHGFMVDIGTTILYGICSNCSGVHSTHDDTCKCCSAGGAK